jgi:hypothetical protein
VRKATLASIVRNSRPGVRLNEHIAHPEGTLVFQNRSILESDPQSDWPQPLRGPPIGPSV